MIRRRGVRTFFLMILGCFWLSVIGAAAREYDLSGYELEEIPSILLVDKELQGQASLPEQAFSSEYSTDAYDTYLFAGGSQIRIGCSDPASSFLLLPILNQQEVSYEKEGEELVFTLGENPVFLTSQELVQSRSDGQEDPEEDWVKEQKEMCLLILQDQLLNLRREPDKYVFIGDSRTVGMSMSISSAEDVWSAKVSMGYDWMVNSGVPAVDDQITAGTAVICWMGINDLGNINSYISYINAKAADWTARGAYVYYAAIGPVGSTTVTNGQIASFNAALQAGLSEDVAYIDVYTALANNGFGSPDGLHYSAGTYCYIYQYIKDFIKG